MAELFSSIHRKLRLLLFGGKGGVGKTTCAAATALRFALRYPDDPYLLVSTDPAHSLADSVAGSSVFPSNLKLLEFNASEHLEKFKAEHSEKLREIALRGTFLDNDDINRFLDLSLPGLDELLGFLEISKWVESGAYRCIIVDTAPTGHTLRLLSMPQLIRTWLRALDTLLAKHRYMKRLFGGSYRPDKLDDFLQEMMQSVERMEALLRDHQQCRFVPVMVAEELIVRETSALLDELKRLKISVKEIIVNKLYPENRCPVCAGARRNQMEKIGKFSERLSGYSVWFVPLFPWEVQGAEALEKMWPHLEKLSLPPYLPRETTEEKTPYFPRTEEAGELPPEKTSLLLFAGKGGVGKTTLACATALRLAREWPGREILLFSTDPAHSLSFCLDTPIGFKPTRIVHGLTAMEINAQTVFDSLKKQYQEELKKFLGSVLQNLDLAFDREVMERILDLSPSGIDEVMALTLATDLMAQQHYDVLVLDSAPTGHLIRLLELPELIDRWIKAFFEIFLKYRHVFRLPEITRRLVGISKNLKDLKKLLHDPDQSALYAVTILTEMAFQETTDLVAACKRMEIHVPVLFLNLAAPDTECSLCSAVYKRELGMRERFRTAFPETRQTLVYRSDEPRGLETLGQLGHVLYEPAQQERVIVAEVQQASECELHPYAEAADSLAGKTVQRIRHRLGRSLIGKKTNARAFPE